MYRRGTKRKHDEEKENYGNHLHLFQTATRKRESMRIKISQKEAPSSLEYSLESQIRIETSLLEGTSKLLKANKRNSTRSSLEAAKTYILSRHRVDMLKYELNKLRRGRGSPSANLLGNGSRPSYAGVSLSDIRIPLIPRRKKTVSEFAIFVIARIGSQIYDSSLLFLEEGGEREETDLTLDDVILFAKVPSYFDMTLEVYSHRLDDSGSIHGARSSVKLVRSFSKVMSKAITKGMSSSSSSEAHHQIQLQNKEKNQQQQPQQMQGPKFDLIASANLTLEDCSPHIENYELYIDEPQSLERPSLFGSLCCRLAVQPYCCEDEVTAGPLTLLLPSKEKNSGSRKIVWGSLRDWKLFLWKDKSLQEAAGSPFLTIPITRDTILKDSSTSITIATENESWTLFFDKETEKLNSWLSHLSQHATDHKRWKHAAVHKMEVLSPDHIKQHPPQYFKTLNRTRSKLVLLYNNIESL